MIPRFFLTLLIALLPLQVLAAFEHCIVALTPDQIELTHDAILKGWNSDDRFLDYRTLNEEGDQALADMRALGLPVPLVNGTPTVPPHVPTVYRNLQNAIDALVRDGRVTEGQTLRPGYAIRRGRGEIRIIPWGQSVPEGWAMYGNEVNQVMPFVNVLEGLRDGLFPLGTYAAGDPYGQGYITILEHDLYHFTAYLRWPEYMAALRGMAATVLSTGNTENISQGTSLYWRWYAITESIMTVKPIFRSRILRWAGVAPRVGQAPAPIPLAVFLKASKGWSAEKLVRVFKALKKNQPRMLERVGGSARDPFNRWTNIHDLLREDFATAHYSILPFNRKTDVQRGRFYLAKTLCAHYNLSLITPEQWVRAGARTHYDRDGLLGRILCDMGVLLGEPRSRSSLITGYCD